MPVFKKIKAKAKSSRGGDAPDFVLKQFEENYASWQENLAQCEEAERQKIIDEFNEVEDGLGDALSGDVSDFKMYKADLDTEMTKTFVEHLGKYFGTGDEEEAE